MEGGEAIRRGDAFDVGPRADEPEPPITRAGVAPATLTTLEQVARGFDLVKGPAEVVLQFEDGLFTTAWLKRRVTLKRLGEFEPVFREASTSDKPLPSALIERPE
jgi:hypothetical protein